MIHPNTELRFIDDLKGFGVVATEFIPKGTITWAGDKLDTKFTQEEFDNATDLFKPILEKYCYRNSDGRWVLCWDISRYVNHSFRSNCISTPYNFEIAVRDIYPGEELTDDYGYLNVSEPIYFPKEEGSDRDSVRPDDLINYSEVWDKQLEEAFSNFLSVNQPLMSLIEKQYYDKVMSVAKGETKMDSIRNCYCASDGIMK